MPEIIASPKVKEYFQSVAKEIDHCYRAAEEVRKKGLDPEDKVDIPLANNMAERVTGLISIAAPQFLDKNISSKITKRIQELEEQYSLLDWRVALKIGEEVAKEKFCTFNNKLEAMEIGIRTGFAYLTLGIVSAPLEGFIGLKIKKRKDGGEYFAVQYAGPIRGAGGTAAATSLVLSDYIRVKMGYAKYDPEENEVSRWAIEIQDYHERVTNLQYRPSDDEVKFLARHVPIEIDGDPTEKFDVSNYKDLPRIEANAIRGGFCLVLAEGLSQKAPKIWKRLKEWGKDFDLEWGFLEDFLALQKKIKAQEKTTTKSEEKIKPNYTFIADLVAGRPVLSYPLAIGGFRLRYGRTRVSGFCTAALSPSIQFLLNKYIAIGTQLKIERPSKGASVSSCDALEGPIVRLKDQSVLQVKNLTQAKELNSEIEEIIFLGDILFDYGDFSEFGHILIPAGYNPEWWIQELEKSVVDTFGNLDLEKLSNLLEIDLERLKELFSKPLIQFPSAEEAIKISQEMKIPLHPSYTYHWKLIDKASLVLLKNWFLQVPSSFKKDLDQFLKIILPLTKETQPAKKVLEYIGLPHLVIGKENVVIEAKEANILAHCLNFNNQEDLNNLDLNPFPETASALDIINQISKIKLRDKSGTFIGARMGRPEKAKMRKMTGSPHAMFPVGAEGDRLRSFQSALTAGKIHGDFPFLYCPQCKKETIYRVCEVCKTRTQQRYHCRFCGDLAQDKCKHGPAQKHKSKDLDIKHYFDNALSQLQLKIFPDLIKGVKGTSNKNHVPENLIKGILRAKHDIYVNKDGTTRYDCTEQPITHFKPKEVCASVQKLKELGYDKDIYNQELTEDNQVLELFPQDIILPGYDSLEGSAPKILFQVAEFLDELLVKFYGAPPFYNLKTKEDLIGHLVVGLAPHISAGLIGRIVGFSQIQSLLAHPMWHAGLRRDCVHPQTRFVYSEKETIKVEKIGDYIENLLKQGHKTKVIDQSGTIKIECKDELYAFGVDSQKKLFKKKRIKYFIKGPKPKNWIKITTATNRKYVMTPTHDFMFVENDQFHLKKAKEVKIGDQIPILNSFKIAPQKIKNLNLIKLFIENIPENKLKNTYLINKNFFKEFVKKITKTKLLNITKNPKFKRNLHEWYLRTPLDDIKELINLGLLDYNTLAQNTKIRTHFSLRSFSPHLNINEELVSLLGYYAAEGYCRQTKTVSQVSFRIGDKVIQKEIIKLIKNLFGFIPNLGEDSTKITICDQLVYNIFKYCFKAGSGAYDKKVPEIIFNAEDKLVAKYISSFLDGDGSVVPERNFIVFYSVNRGLLDDIALLLTKFKVFSRYHTTSPRLPGKKVLEIYRRLKKEPKRHILHHLIIGGRDVNKLKEILSLNCISKVNKLKKLKIKNCPRGTIFGGRQYFLKDRGDIIIDYVKKIDIIKDNSSSYCLEIDWENEGDKNILWGEQILNTRCDGDEAAVMLLMDSLLNFSRQFLPETRGAKTMDSPLVLTGVLNPAEIDDQVHGLSTARQYPLEFYQAALDYKEPKESKIEQIRDRLNKPSQYEGFGFTLPVENFNHGIQCSAYKTLPTMVEKLTGQMEIAQKVRAVNREDVARLVIEKHFIKDIRGNLRKFSTQQFRCVKCNEKFRRPPLSNKCNKCGNKLLFTISEGSVVKYLSASLGLCRDYDFSPYLKQSLEIVEENIHIVFGKDKEKQVGLGGFMQ